MVLGINRKIEAFTKITRCNIKPVSVVDLQVVANIYERLFSHCRNVLGV